MDIGENTDSKNYRMYFEEDYIKGYCEKLLAMRQVIYKILNTERYKYIIYSWNYGIELMGLLGKPIAYVCPELERRITEALISDSRIDSVYNFTFELIERNVLYTKFTVRTIFGDVEASKILEI